MSEISEEQSREAAARIRSRETVDIEECGINELLDRADDWKTITEWARQELSRRDAERAASQQPITPEWCLANGAAFSASWYWFDEGVRLRPISGGKWIVIVSGRMLDWSAECVGQVEDLRKALRGGA